MTKKIDVLPTITALVFILAVHPACADGNGWMPAKNPDDGFFYVCTNGIKFYSPSETENLPSKDTCTELLVYKEKMLSLKSELNKAANFDRIKQEILISR